MRGRRRRTERSRSEMRGRRRIEWRLFLAAWSVYAFFHQGGGWNQNARFAMVRAVVEEGRLDVDDHLLYTGVAQSAAGPVLRRSRVTDAHFEVGGRRYALAWPAAEPVPVRAPLAGAELVALDRVAASGDVSFAQGRFHPNKAPGAALLAVPAYFAVHLVERGLGLDPDAWWVLTLNAWLVTALSIGVVSALGCAVFFRTCLGLWPDRTREAAWATLAFGLGTPFLPYATLLLEQNAAAVALLLAFLGTRSGLGTEDPARAARRLLLAGVAAGVACATSYVAALPALWIGLYALARARQPNRLAWALLGSGGVIGLLALYHAACFGSPWATAYRFQNPLFRDPDALLGVLRAPRLEPLVGVLVSPYRGLFYASPVLLLAAFGWLGMLRRREERPEALLFAAITGSLLLFCASFNGWHGGWVVGPRYLAPALPFLGLPLVPALARHFRLGAALAALSIAGMAILTAVDPQSPVGSSPIAERPGRPLLLRDPLTEYALPILIDGKATPILEAQRAARGAGAVLPLEHFTGPVSAHPIGVYEAWIGRVLRPPAPELRWNAFNAGELLLPGSRWSLALLAAVATPLWVGALRAAGRTR